MTDHLGFLHVATVQAEMVNISEKGHEKIRRRSALPKRTLIGSDLDV